jgi:xanthine/CO dehydrogenase XdhC/CoxF family maturation factor
VSKELSDIVRESQARGDERLALATLVRARGSSYRRPGARMLICEDGTSVGSLSGGCLEEEVAVCARGVIRSGIPALLSFDTRRRFGCNGAIEIFVEPLDGTFAAGLAASVSRREGCRAATVFEGNGELGSRLLRNDEDVPAGAFVQQIDPAIRMIVFGSGPDSLPLRAFADTLGWQVLEVDRATDLPTNADRRTAAVVKSHNYGRDFAALKHLLQLDLPYVALMGPRARRDQLLHALLDDGASFTSQLYAPAGLDLNAETPEEIALAIVSEIQAALNGGSADSLRDRKVPIHGWNSAAQERAAQCQVSAR